MTVHGVKDFVSMPVDEFVAVELAYAIAARGFTHGSHLEGSTLADFDGLKLTLPERAFLARALQLAPWRSATLSR